MTNSFEITSWLKEIGKIDNLAIDWLIKSWSLKGEDNQIAKLFYKKACKERKILVERMYEMARG